jgi:hypothetical protein
MAAKPSQGTVAKHKHRQRTPRACNVNVYMYTLPLGTATWHLTDAAKTHMLPTLSHAKRKAFRPYQGLMASGSADTATQRCTNKAALGSVGKMSWMAHSSLCCCTSQ